ncbi:MAG: DUF2953 domain-containing protein [Clostridia bacterium]|nr:DUF2953 domain-containing protein [Clostridia bacterium]
MIFLWILLGILLFLCALILLPVSIKIGYDTEVTLSLGAFGIYFPLYPKKKKKPKLLSRKKYLRLRQKDEERAERKRLAAQDKAKKKQNAKAAKKAEAEKKLPPSEMEDEPSVMKILLRIVAGVLDTFFGKLRVKIARVHIVVGGPDAAKTAITYGIVSQGVAYLMELISCKTKMSREDNTSVSVVPDFLAKTTTADLLILFRLRLIDLLSTGIVFFIRFMKEKTASAPKKQ